MENEQRVAGVHVQRDGVYLAIWLSGTRPADGKIEVRHLRLGTILIGGHAPAWEQAARWLADQVEEAGVTHFYALRGRNTEFKDENGFTYLRANLQEVVCKQANRLIDASWHSVVNGRASLEAGRRLLPEGMPLAASTAVALAYRGMKMLQACRARENNE